MATTESELRTRSTTTTSTTSANRLIDDPLVGAMATPIKIDSESFAARHGGAPTIGALPKIMSGKCQIGLETLELLGTLSVFMVLLGVYQPDGRTRAVAVLHRGIVVLVFLLAIFRTEFSVFTGDSLDARSVLRQTIDLIIFVFGLYLWLCYNVVAQDPFIPVFVGDMAAGADPWWVRKQVTLSSRLLSALLVMLGIVHVCWGSYVEWQAGDRFAVGTYPLVLVAYFTCAVAVSLGLVLVRSARAHVLVVHAWWLERSRKGGLELGQCLVELRHLDTSVRHLCRILQGSVTGILAFSILSIVLSSVLLLVTLNEEGVLKAQFDNLFVMALLVAATFYTTYSIQQMAQITSAFEDLAMLIVRLPFPTRTQRYALMAAFRTANPGYYIGSGLRVDGSTYYLMAAMTIVVFTLLARYVTFLEF